MPQICIGVNLKLYFKFVQFDKGNGSGRRANQYKVDTATNNVILDLLD